MKTGQRSAEWTPAVTESYRQSRLSGASVHWLQESGGGKEGGLKELVKSMDQHCESGLSVTYPGNMVGDGGYHVVEAVSGGHIPVDPLLLWDLLQHHMAAQ